MSVNSEDTAESNTEAKDDVDMFADKEESDEEEEKTSSAIAAESKKEDEGVAAESPKGEVKSNEGAEEAVKGKPDTSLANDDDVNSKDTTADSQADETKDGSFDSGDENKETGQPEDQSVADTGETDQVETPQEPQHSTETAGENDMSAEQASTRGQGALDSMKELKEKTLPDKAAVDKEAILNLLMFSQVTAPQPEAANQDETATESLDLTLEIKVAAKDEPPRETEAPDMETELATKEKSAEATEVVSQEAQSVSEEETAKETKVETVEESFSGVAETESAAKNDLAKDTVAELTSEAPPVEKDEVSKEGQSGAAEIEPAAKNESAIEPVVDIAETPSEEKDEVCEESLSGAAEAESATKDEAAIEPVVELTEAPPEEKDEASKEGQSEAAETESAAKNKSAIEPVVDMTETPREEEDEAGKESQFEGAETESAAKDESVIEPVVDILTGTPAGGNDEASNESQSEAAEAGYTTKDEIPEEPNNEVERESAPMSIEQPMSTNERVSEDIGVGQESTSDPMDVDEDEDARAHVQRLGESTCDDVVKKDKQPDREQPTETAVPGGPSAEESKDDTEAPKEIESNVEVNCQAIPEVVEESEGPLQNEFTVAKETSARDRNGATPCLISDDNNNDEKPPNKSQDLQQGEDAMPKIQEEEPVKSLTEVEEHGVEKKSGTTAPEHALLNGAKHTPLRDKDFDLKPESAEPMLIDKPALMNADSPPTTDPTADFVRSNTDAKGQILVSSEEGQEQAGPTTVKRLSIVNRPDATIEEIKIHIYTAGVRAHRGKGTEKLFASYWGALCRCFGISLNGGGSEKRARMLNGTREVIKKFLTTKKLRRLHNSLILGKDDLFLKRCHFILLLISFPFYRSVEPLCR